MHRVDWGILIFGGLATLITFIDLIYPPFIPSVTGNLPTGLLTLILGYLGYERIMVKKEITDKIDKFVSIFSELKGIDIIYNTSGITDQTIRAIGEAEERIRVTSFKPTNAHNDTGLKYYEILSERLKNSNIRYECALNKNSDLSNRIKALEKYNDDEKNIILNKMVFYAYYHDQRPMNLIIVDNKFAFIGFYTHQGDPHMETVIEISNSSEMGRKFISRLISWYDSFIRLGTGSDSKIEKFTGTEFLLKNQN